MDKRIVVVFSQKGAEVFINPVGDFSGLSNVAIDPDLTEVKGLSPHLWRLKDGQVVPCATELWDDLTAEAHKDVKEFPLVLVKTEEVIKEVQIPYEVIKEVPVTNTVYQHTREPAPAPLTVTKYVTTPGPERVVFQEPEPPLQLFLYALLISIALNLIFIAGYFLKHAH